MKQYLSEYKGKNILITGGAGCIGSNLTRSLLNLDAGKVTVLDDLSSSPRWNVPDSPNVVFIHGSILSEEALKKAFSQKLDFVFHLAALIAIPYSYVAPASYISTNVQGTLNVLEACSKQGVSRLVHTSTSEVYGTAQYTPIDERHPVVGQSPYSASKIGADHLAESYYRSFQLPVSIIRPFNTFGPRQSARAVIPTTITQALSGAEVIRLGSLEPIRDLTYVKDMVEGFEKVAESDEAIGRVTNIGRGEGNSIEDLVRVILEACGSSAQIETDLQRVRPEKSEVFELVCDNNQAFQRLEWRPRVSLVQGIEETIEWFKKNLHGYKPSIYNL